MARTTGLGTFVQLDDNTLMLILGRTSPRELAALCACSDVLHAFASCDDLWCVACIRHVDGGSLSFFCSTW